MSEDPSTTTTVETSESAPEVTATVETRPGDDPRVTKANKEAAEYRKQLRAVQAELDKVRQASLSEAEKAIAEAKQSGLTEAQRAAAPRLVRAEMRAAAAEAGLAKEALESFLEYADLTKFVGEDGEPDTDAIGKAVARLAPAKPAEDTSRQPGPRPDLSQGSRNQMALNSDALTDALKAAVGAR